VPPPNLTCYRMGIYFALVQIHAAGVSHGDVEPRNVVRRRWGTPCFVDFGLSTTDHRCQRDTCEELAHLRSALQIVEENVDAATACAEYN
jgi:tRNA A-37 threonylcarbamoyl transferase component Bud32